jgi:hypothetical protein
MGMVRMFYMIHVKIQVNCMKKFIFSIICLIVVAIVVASVFQKKEETSNQGTEENNVIDNCGDGFYIETLSDKDIYCPGTYVCLTYMPQSKRELYGDMISLANSYAILRAAYCDAELWFRFGMVVNDSIGHVHLDSIWDLEARNAVDKYVKTLVDIIPRDTALWNQSDSILWDKVWSAYTTCADKLSKRFALRHYGKITEKDVVKYMDIKQFIPNYDSIYDLRRKQSEENERYLLLMAEQTPSFDRECLYTIEYAHQRRHEEPHKAIPMLEKLMESGKFSRYLHEVWRTWRCLRQVAESPSRDGMILNLEYNKMRYKCLKTILTQIMQDPKDIYAINDFCFLATYDNITRYSEFMFGNSAPLEHMMLFPEILDDDN